MINQIIDNFPFQGSPHLSTSKRFNKGNILKVGKLEESSSNSNIEKCHTLELEASLGHSYSAIILRSLEVLNYIKGIGDLRQQLGLQ